MSSAVTAAGISGASTAANFGFMHLFMNADMIVKSVMVLLILMSISSWAIIFEKLVKFKLIKHKLQLFEDQFWSGSMLDQLYENVKNRVDNPGVMVFIAAMQEWKRQDVRRAINDNSLKTGVKERIFQAMNVARNRGIEDLENRLGFLATVGSTGPFIGLFGTVWGIMNSFQSIAITKNTTLAAVAPGIAEALFATAIGLIAAIPAVIFYNKFSGDLNKISNKVDDFASEFASIISRELDIQK